MIYDAVYGLIPEGHMVDHDCHNEDLSCGGGKTCAHRRCCNWFHYGAKTNEENLVAANAPRLRAEFKTHCRNGHPYNDENTMWIQQADKKGIVKEVRRCKACNRNRVYKAKTGKERPADDFASLSRAGCGTCRRGHPYDEENTKYDSTTGKRRCRKCERLNDLNSKRRKKGLPPLAELPIAS